MSEKRKDGGPAFWTGDPTHGGMSLRDWFAGQALTGIETFGCYGATHSARYAYLLADAMLAEREKTNG